MAESNKPKIPIICIVGPTASGKTALSIALAKKYNLPYECDADIRMMKMLKKEEKKDKF